MKAKDVAASQAGEGPPPRPSSVPHPSPNSPHPPGDRILRGRNFHALPLGHNLATKLLGFLAPTWVVGRLTGRPCGPLFQSRSPPRTPQVLNINKFQGWCSDTVFPFSWHDPCFWGFNARKGFFTFLRSSEEALPRHPLSFPLLPGPVTPTRPLLPTA